MTITTFTPPRQFTYMEGIVMPLPSWDDWPEKACGFFWGSGRRRARIWF